MKTVIPHYYRAFRCIASACRHNCCLEGWEIDLDDAHVELYKKLAEEQEKNGEPSIREGLVLPTVRERRNGNVPHIRLKENGVCPFLNPEGLCKLILDHGEKAICQICTDHPRFRNYYKNHMELGVGLCCEEACRIILEDEQMGRYEELATGAEAVPMHQKLELKKKALELSGISLDFRAWAEYLLGLECLEGSWRQLLEKYLTAGQEQTKAKEEWPAAWDRRFMNLEEYFLYRYGAREGAGFASFSTRLIRELAQMDQSADEEELFKQLKEICRLYSSEIEYSEDNRKAVIERLQREQYR